MKLPNNKNTGLTYLKWNCITPPLDTEIVLMNTRDKPCTSKNGSGLIEPHPRHDKLKHPVIEEDDNNSISGF